MPSYRPPAPVPDPVRWAYEQAWSDTPDPEEETYAAGVAWGSAAPFAGWTEDVWGGELEDDIHRYEEAAVQATHMQLNT